MTSRPSRTSRSAPRDGLVDWATLTREARERFGIERLRPPQRALIAAALRGRNTLGVLPTGAGKSLCFQLPALVLPKATVVVSPLIALMQDQTQKLAAAEVMAAKLNSSLTAREALDTEAAIAEGGRDIIYVTPERLENPECLAMLQARGVSLFVVDEAHCVSHWGHDFRPAYLTLRDAVRALGSPPVMALTATAPPELAVDLLRELGIDDAVVVREDVERANLFYEVARTPSEDAKRIKLAEILARAATQRHAVIVYVATVKLADELCEWLRARGTPALEYHGKLPMRAREEAQARFMDGSANVIVATNAFGLGIDKPDVRVVVHYTFPDSLETYYQESGRGGRDGRPARAVLLYRLEDRRIQSYFLGGKYPRREESARVYELVRGGASSVSAIAELGNLSLLRTRVVVSLLEQTGVLARRGKRLEKLRDFESDAELGGFLSTYEARHHDDRKRLSALMDWAQSTRCRWRALEEWFGETPEADCGHCDNCRDQPARALASKGSPKREALPPLAPPAAAAVTFAEGARVRHARFGPGEVVRSSGAKATVRFQRGGEKTLLANRLSRLPAAP